MVKYTRLNRQANVYCRTSNVFFSPTVTFPTFSNVTATRKRVTISSAEIITTDMPPKGRAILTSYDILDDLWVAIFLFLNARSFIGVQYLCQRFHTLFHNKKYGLNNKYWERECKDLCCSITPNYSTTEWFTFYGKLKKVIRYVRRERKCNKDGTRINLNTGFLPIYPACVHNCHLIFDMYVFQDSEFVNADFYDISKDTITERDFKCYDNRKHNINTPLLVSIEANIVNMVKYLLSQPNIQLNLDKSKVVKRNEHSKFTSPLIVACIHGFYHIAELLLSHGGINTKTKQSIIFTMNDLTNTAAIILMSIK